MPGFCLIRSTVVKNRYAWFAAACESMFTPAVVQRNIYFLALGITAMSQLKLSQDLETDKPLDER